MLTNTAVWLRGASQLRRRWRSWLGLALLIGVAGGFVVASVAGARRTATAYDRLLDQSRPFDFVVGAGCAEDVDDEECVAEASASLEQVFALEPVEDGGLLMSFLVPVLTDDGFSIQPQEEVFNEGGGPPGEVCFTGNGGLDVSGSPDGRLGTELNRHRFVAGRAARPTAADEVVMSVATARRVGVHVGDSLRIVPVDACDAPAPDEWPEPIEVTVVGLEVSPGAVQPASGRYFQSVTVTPPLVDRLASALDDQQAQAMILLRDGATATDLEDAIESAGLPIEIHIAQEYFTTSVRRGLRPDALTLWLLAALGAVASAVVLGQALSRQAWAEADELPALRAIGFTSRDLGLVGAVEGAAMALVGGVGSAVLAVALSPLFPMGRARLAEPDPGIRVDSLVVGLGALVVATAAFVVVAVAARRVAARSTGAPVAFAGRPSPVTALLARVGAGSAAVVGARMALERGRGARSVPVRTGFAGVAVGVAALAGSLTFGADLEHLLATPRLVGWNWDVAFFGGIEPADPDAEVDLAQADKLVDEARGVEGVERAGYVTIFPTSDVPVIESLPEVWLMSFSTGPGSITPTITSGRAPAGPDEIMVSRTVLADLGLEVGDPLDVRGATMTESGDQVPTTAIFTIVGTGVLPLGDGLFDQTVAVTFDGLRRLTPSALPQMGIVGFEPGADRARTTAALEEIGLVGPVDAEHLDLTALVDLDVRGADNLPRLLGALMTVLAAGVLMHLVYTGVRTHRHDLATLRALGFTRAQVARAIAWQTTIATAAPFVVGAIVGAVVGGAVWLVYAEGLGVVPEAVVAWRPIAGFLIAFLVAANVFGAVVGRSARRRSAAEVLRTE